MDNLKKYALIVRDPEEMEELKLTLQVAISSISNSASPAIYKRMQQLVQDIEAAKEI